MKCCGPLNVTSPVPANLCLTASIVVESCKEKKNWEREKGDRKIEKATKSKWYWGNENRKKNKKADGLAHN